MWRKTLSSLLTTTRECVLSSETKGFAGACMLGYGCWLVRPWMGWCVGGLLLLAAAVGEQRGRSRH